MKPLRFAWVGFHAEGGPAFEALMQAGAPIHGVITLTPERRARRSGAIDYAPLCARYGVPLHEIVDINGPDGLAALGAIRPDVAFVIGWSQIVRPPALRMARIGMIGAHASPLPRYRGSAPVNWALIKGETETGNSLIWLAEGVDRGAVIDQVTFSISRTTPARRSTTRSPRPIATCCCTCCRACSPASGRAGPSPRASTRSCRGAAPPTA